MAVRDKGAKRFGKIVQELREFSKNDVWIGWQGATGAEQAVDEDGTPSDATQADVGTFLEFGTEPTGFGSGVPEYAFLRNGLDDNQDNILKLQRDMVNQVMDGRMDARRASERIGIFGQTIVQRKIRDTISPANLPATIKAKKSSNPGIDTGATVQAVTYTLRDGNTTKVTGDVRSQ